MSISNCFRWIAPFVFLTSSASVHEVRIHDPELILSRALGGNQRQRCVEALEAFHNALSGENFAGWNVSVGVAFVGTRRLQLHKLAESLADSWGLNDAIGKNHSGVGIVVAIRTHEGKSSFAVAGSILVPSYRGSEEHFLDSNEWTLALRVAERLLEGGRPADAVQILLDSIVVIVSGANSLADFVEHHTVMTPHVLEEWDSEYHHGSVWSNVCGEARCVEMFIDGLRTSSTAFHHYYDEAMAFPALNMLGASTNRRVLVLGGCDGGIASQVLRFNTVDEVVNVDIDKAVFDKSSTYFSKISSSLSDRRYKRIHSDAFAWVRDIERVGRHFDLIAIDFRHAPLVGLLPVEFFMELRRLLTSDGIIVQSLGTMREPRPIRDLLSMHASLMPSVFAMTMVSPDFESPYILSLSSMMSNLDPLKVDWNLWEHLKLFTKYYDGKAQHRALFTGLAADLCDLIGMNRMVPSDSPHPVKLPLPEYRQIDTFDVAEQLLYATESPLGNKIQVWDTPRRLELNGEEVLGDFAAYHDENLVLPALSILGDKAKHILVLGGGSGSLVVLALRWPSVRKVVLVEIDPLLVETIHNYFPPESSALNDTRTEVVLRSSFEWITSADRHAFDLVIVNVLDKRWLAASKVTRVPRTNSFYKELKALVAPGGLLVQDAGSRYDIRPVAHILSLHRRNFATTFPVAFAHITKSMSSAMPIVQNNHYRDPHLLLLSSLDDAGLDPCNIDWQYWTLLPSDDHRHNSTSLRYYHPSLQCSLFTLPAELQRALNAFPPRLSCSVNKGFLLNTPSQLDVLESDSRRWLLQDIEFEAYNCSERLINDAIEIGALLGNLSTLCGLVAMGGVEHQFSPQGVTALLAFPHAHVGIHTWPEIGYAVIDVVSHKAVSARTGQLMRLVVRERLGCGSVDFTMRTRGDAGPSTG